MTPNRTAALAGAALFAAVGGWGLLAALSASDSTAEVVLAGVFSTSVALATLHLVENPDILKGLVARRDAGELKDGVVIAGFAAETGDATHSALDFARAKFERKGCDVLMANEVGVGKVFGQTTNSGWILRRGAEPTVVELGSKQVVAAQILDAVNAIASE